MERMHFCFEIYFLVTGAFSFAKIPSYFLFPFFGIFDSAEQCLKDVNFWLFFWVKRFEQEMQFEPFVKYGKRKITLLSCFENTHLQFACD